MKIYNEERSFFYQWDSNMKLTAPDLSVGDEVHFANATTPEALVVKAYELDGAVVVNVPNILLQVPFPLSVYRLVKRGDSEYTREDYTFPVQRRPKPSDYVYTETEVHDIDSAVKAAIEKAMENGDFGGDVDQKVEAALTTGRADILKYSTEEPDYSVIGAINRSLLDIDSIYGYISDIENEINGVEEELQMLNEGGIQ